MTHKAGDCAAHARQSPAKSVKYSWLHRARWNVVDLVTIIGHDARPATIYYDIDMTWVKSLKKTFHDKGRHLTVTAVLLKAIAIAQRSHPDSRAFQFPWGRVATFDEIVAGFTVEREVGDQPAVFFGTIDSPDEKSLDKIMQELKDYSSQSINKHPQLHRESQFSQMPWLLRQSIFRLAMYVPRFRLWSFPGTFGLSSLGKYGATVVTGPCVCTSTFGVGALEDRAVATTDGIVVRPMLSLSLLYDQRCMDGGQAARFISDVKELLEGELQEYLSQDLLQ